MRKILITGGCGMIGSNLAKRLIEQGDDVTIVDNLWRGKLDHIECIPQLRNNPEKVFIRDLTIPGSIDDLIGKHPYIYHLADIVAGIAFVFGNQRWVMRQNVLMNSNVFDAVANNYKAIQGLVYVGTACSYPKQLQYGVNAPPLKEDDMYPANPESAYGWSKLFGQIESGFLSSELGVPVATPVLHNVYGTPCDLTEGRSQVIPALCKKIALQRDGCDVVVWGSGAQGRSFVHVDDVVDALVLVLDKGMGAGDIQIGSSQCIPVREIVQTLIRISGKKLTTVYDRTRPEGDAGRCADSTKARTVLGWQPRVGFYPGLASTYEWVAAQLQK